MGIEDFANECQKRLRDVLRGSGGTTYLSHPDTSAPAITAWIIQGRPEKDNTQEILITVEKDEPSLYEDSNESGSTITADTEIKLHLFVSGISRSGSPRSDNTRRVLIKQINRTILNNKKSSFSDLGVTDIKFNHLDVDDPDNVSERHTAYRVSFSGEESFS